MSGDDSSSVLWHGHPERPSSAGRDNPERP
jgi:hypothetical protein